MHNTRPTYGNKNIDILVSDMVHHYSEPIIIQNVLTDIPDGQPGGGKRSDHPIIYSTPRLERESQSAKELVLKKTRRFNDARKKEMAKWIQHESWEDLFNSTKPAEKFEEIVFGKLDEICPEEVIKITKLDGKVKSLALQKLGRQKLREYTKHGNSNKFKALKIKQQARVKFESKKALNKMLENAIKQDLKENGKEKIIERELNNHECYYTGEIDQSVIDSLSDYSISKKEIIDQFNKNIDNYEFF